MHKIEPLIYSYIFVVFLLGSSYVFFHPFRIVSLKFSVVSTINKVRVAPEVLMYLNRLSDYFYLLGRTLTEYFSVEETLWIP